MEGVSRQPVSSTADELQAVAHAYDAGLIVMGAFGHMRLKEYVFGGVTRDLLLQSDVPLFLCH